MSALQRAANRELAIRKKALLNAIEAAANAKERENAERMVFMMSVVSPSPPVPSMPSSTPPVPPMPSTSTSQFQIHPRCNASLFHGLEARYAEIMQAQHTARGRPFKGEGLWASKWCLREKAKNPRLRLEDAVQLARETAETYPDMFTPAQRQAMVQLTAKTLRNHVPTLMENTVWKFVCGGD